MCCVDQLNPPPTPVIRSLSRTAAKRTITIGSFTSNRDHPSVLATQPEAVIQRAVKELKERSESIALQPFVKSHPTY
jgi:hypothetical protein